MPPPTVDAQPARKHLKELLRYTDKQNLMKALGISRRAQQRLLDPDCERISRRVSDIILAQTPGDLRLGQRRITAQEQIDEFMHLRSLGVSVVHAARQLGIKVESLGNMLRRAGIEVPEDVQAEYSRARNRSEVA